MKDILKTVEKTLQKRKLAEKDDKVLVAFSGGSDSVYLLYAMKNLGEKIGFSVAAAHLNHGMRDCADEEEAFSENMCKEWNIEFFSKKVDVPSLAEKLGISSETAGRKARYDFFEELRKEQGFTKIATAHHSDDNAETILMHFIRGSGANGLKGIEYIRDSLIIRPLLDISKQEIYNECKRLELEYVTDMSNFEPVYTRNKIRLELIPEIMKYNPNFSSTITSNATLFAEDEEFINAYTNKIFDENYNGGFSKKIIDGLPRAVSRRIIQCVYSKISGENQLLSQKYIDAALDMENGKKLSLPKNVTLYLYGGRYTAVKEKQKFESEVKIGQKTHIPYTDEVWKITYADKSDKNTFFAPKNCMFVIRSRKTGDRFYPLGSNGSKSVSDLFTDKKIAPFERDFIPVLTADEKIVNIGGRYKDRRFYKERDGVLFKLEIKHGSDDF